ncbi:molybdopterin molybdotransferase MoeA [Roseibacillus ishigakijimensis]|uniref:Molybdopterin molybdenumtransferase n=1 Tax=Roseibacillus ishigakijimensis TaxID=454146 RepID=A0A934RRN2_9BACT|nr:molybdopterin molybdotransferase MoeA [Roseibacillus ishigakijimensis]MBK1834208.1 molybdopterin molybdotransferase MoeA [Roseibacillus ishigakijimensis]
MDSLISPAEADEIIAASLQALPAEPVYFLDALARTLRETLCADRDFPPFDRVTMDGIACRSLDLTLPALTLQGLHPAGDPAPAALLPGHCWQVMTGAVLPSDCDTIVPVEELHLREKRVSLRKDAEPQAGQFIHRQGSDCVAGCELLQAGTTIAPAHLGLAATIGKTELLVTRQPRITLLTTGDELIPPSEKPAPHQLRQSNGPVLLGALQAFTRDCQHLHLSDDLGATRLALEEAIAASDLVLLSGGISKGKKDYVRPALQELVGPPAFHGIAQRPGKPLAYWSPRSESPPIFALPGNPNSTLTTFLRYVRPALSLLAGSLPAQGPLLPLREPLTPHDRLTLFLPASIQPDGRLLVIKPQNSGDFASTLNASGFVEVPPGPDLIQQALYHANF